MTSERTRMVIAALAVSFAGCGDSATVVDSGIGVDSGPMVDAADDASTDASVTTSGCEVGLARDPCFLREEEKLARDVYITLYGTSGIRVFDNISGAEQTHTDAVRDLLLARSLPDPVVDDTVGAFVDPTLDGLYVDLVASGQTDDVSALEVGATIEDLDIRDIEEMAARTDDVDALALYDSLSCGSRNHMRAFIGQLESRGETYVPQYISVDEFNAIIGAARETCASP